MPLKFLRHYHYIYADNRLVALHIATVATDSTPATDSMYYVHTDHLGSICALTNAEQQVRQRNWFGPFGDYGGVYYEPFAVVRQGEGEDTTATRGASGLKFPLTTRGFTGHEHYPYFKIINMNGRLYDPIICRFFSPDNFVQLPEFSQNYNRYSYCLNNPLKYIDPSGQKIVINGDASKQYYSQVRTGAKALGISVRMNRDGVLSANFKGKGDLSLDGQKFLNAVTSKDVTVNINAIYNNIIDGQFFVGGAFMGNTVHGETIGKDDFIPKSATAYQTVNPDDLQAMDDFYGAPGKTSIHEITESYEGGRISLKNGISSGNSSQPNSVYEQAHDAATPQSGVLKKFYYNAADRQIRDPNMYGSAKWVDFVAGEHPIQKVINTWKVY